MTTQEYDDICKKIDMMKVDASHCNDIITRGDILNERKKLMKRRNELKKKLGITSAIKNSVSSVASNLSNREEVLAEQEKDISEAEQEYKVSFAITDEPESFSEGLFSNEETKEELIRKINSCDKVLEIKDEEYSDKSISELRTIHELKRKDALRLISGSAGALTTAYISMVSWASTTINDDLKRDLNIDLNGIREKLENRRKDIEACFHDELETNPQLAELINTYMKGRWGILGITAMTTLDTIEENKKKEFLNQK